MTPEELLDRVARIVEAEVEFLIDSDRTSITYSEAEKIADEEGIHVSTVIRMFRDWGVTVNTRSIARNVRGFKSNPNTRWAACPSHGGSGWEVISGFAGRAG